MMAAPTHPVPRATDHARRTRSATVTVVRPDTPPLVAVIVAVPSLRPATIRSSSMLTASGADEDHENRIGSKVEP